MSTTDESRPRATALVADDDPITRRLLRAFLERMEFEVIEVADGEALVEECRKAKPAIIITDVQMPGMDGFEACAEIRKTHSTNDLPILAISGWYDEQRTNYAAKVGITSCLIKPIEWTAFEEHVTSVLNQSKNGNAVQTVDRDSV